MNNCEACGKSIPRESNFCIHCGASQTHSGVSSLASNFSEIAEGIQGQPRAIGVNTTNFKESNKTTSQTEPRKKSLYWRYAFPLGICLSLLHRCLLVSYTGYFNVGDFIGGFIFNSFFFGLIVFGLLKLISSIKNG